MYFELYSEPVVGEREKKPVLQNENAEFIKHIRKLKLDEIKSNI